MSFLVEKAMVFVALDEGLSPGLWVNCSTEMGISTKRAMGGIQYIAAIMTRAIRPAVKVIRVIFQWDMKNLLSMVT